MKIAYLAHRIPFPPNKGDKIRSYHHVRHLARRHELHLFAFVDEGEDLAGERTLRELCAGVHLVRLRRLPALGRGALSLAAGRSFSEGFYASREMSRCLSQVASRRGFDVGWAFSAVMAQYLPLVGARRRVVDCVDVDSEKFRQYAEDSRGAAPAFYALESRRLRRFELDLAQHAERVVFVSRAEADLYESLGGCADRVAVAGNGVDLEYFRPQPAPAAEAPTLLFTGALDYRPNVDAVLYFAREVLPRLRRQWPALVFAAVGHRPARALEREAARHGGAFRIFGSVPDVRPYFAAARLFVAPLRAGRGVQNKVLEAMAMGVAVVASPLALAGLGDQARRIVPQASTAEEWVSAIDSLLRDGTRAASLARRGLEWVRSQHPWERCLADLDACLSEDPEPPRARIAAGGGA